MNEYYIRQPDSEEARGPYDLSRIGDLIEAGKADITTLYFDEDREDWIPLADNPDFREILFPEKQRLGLKAKEITESLNRDDDEDEENVVSVDKILAAAEGKTEETSAYRSKDDSYARAAGLALPIMGLTMLLNAALLIGPEFDAIRALVDESDYLGLLTKPELVIGLLDIFFALCCALSATDIYPLMRLRMAVGLGFYTYLFWAWQDPTRMVAAIIGTFGFYLASLTLNLWLVIASAVLALGGFGYLVYLEFLYAPPLPAEEAEEVTETALLLLKSFGIL